MAELKFTIGDAVVVSGPVYQSANGTLTKGEIKNQVHTIEKAIERAAHPYMVKGIFGWFNEEQLKKYIPIPVEINDTVKVKTPVSYGGKKLALRYSDYVVKELIEDKAVVTHGTQTITVNAYNLEKIK